MPDWNPSQLPRLDGHSALITGANSGLGLATAIALGKLGARLWITCRGSVKGEQACAEIRTAAPGVEVTAIDMDLSSLDSVKAAAADLQAQTDTLDLLINNAGVMGLPKMQTRDGFEMVFGVNHLGHFALTGHLLPMLETARAARIVTVASVAAKNGQLPMDDLNWESRPYRKGAAYAQSKLANLSFALELESRLRAKNSPAISVAAHPGYAATNVVFARDAKMSLGRRIWIPLAKIGNWLIAQPAERGAWPSLYVAAMPDVQGGDYYGPHGPLEFRGLPVPVDIKPLAREAGQALWEKSEELTGLRYP